MSRLQPVKTSKRNQRLDWINGIVQIHNLICGCEEPLKHTIEEIWAQEPSLHPYHQSCPGTGNGDHTGDVAELENGDLDRLFADDFGEEDAGTSTG